MKTIFILFLFIITVTSCCKNCENIQSKELVITVENRCIAKIKLLKAVDSSFYASDIFDCDYVKEISFQVAPGKYIIQAESFNNVKKFDFVKTDYKQSFSIEF